MNNREKSIGSLALKSAPKQMGQSQILCKR